MRVIKICILWVLCLQCAFGTVVDEKRHRYIKEGFKKAGLQDMQQIDDFFSLIESNASLQEVELKYEELKGLVETGPEYHFLQRPIYDALWTWKTQKRIENEAIAFYLDKAQQLLANRKCMVFAGNDISYYTLPMLGESQVTILSQNFLHEDGYGEYINSVYGNKVLFPSDEVRMDEFQSTLNRLKHSETPSEGRTKVSFLKFSHLLDQELLKHVMKLNEGKYIFYIDEKYWVKDLHSRARPHGFFLEICPAEDPINEASINEDYKFWSECEKHIASNFSTNQLTQWIFSDNRCMSAGVYASQKLYTEAESAFLQAIRIAPDYWKPRVRICHEVYIPCRRYEDALSILDDYLVLMGSKAADRARELREHVLKLKEDV